MNEQARKRNRLPRWAIVFILLLMAFLTPIVALGAAGDYAYVQVMGTFWYYYVWDMNYNPRIDITINPLVLMMTIPFWFPRLAGVIMTSRLYKGKTTRRRTFAFGAIGECWILAYLILILITYILIPSPYMTYFPYAIPFPFVTITAFILTKVDPPQEGKMWVEEQAETSEYWWEEDKREEEEDTIHVPRREKLW